MKPALIIVTGMPGSGKTTLARTLADAVHFPLLSRDEIYQGLANACSDAATPSAEIAHMANHTLSLRAHSLLEDGVSGQDVSPAKCRDMVQRPSSLAPSTLL